MYYITYISAAVEPFTQADLLALLAKSREKNQRLGVTGMLLYKDGDFLQLLEGDEAVVKALYATIRADARHTGPVVLAEGKAEARLFTDWSMGFRDLSDPAVRDMPGFSPFLDTPLTAERFAKDPNVCLRLFAVFSNPLVSGG